MIKSWASSSSALLICTLPLFFALGGQAFTPRTLPSWVTEVLEGVLCFKNTLSIGQELVKCQDLMHVRIHRYQASGSYSDDVGCCIYFDFLNCVEGKVESLCGAELATGTINAIDKWKFVANCSSERRYIFGYDTCQILLYPRQTHELMLVLFFVIVMPIMFLLTTMMTVSCLNLLRNSKEERCVLVTLNGEKYRYKYESI